MRSPFGCTTGFLRLFGAFACLVIGPAAFTQQNEVALSLGGALSGSRTAAAGELDLGTGIALQANYARRIASRDAAALYVDIHFLASPQRKVDTPIQGATTDFATIYLTPGLKLKFFPGSRVSPYVVAGGGLAVYEQSELNNAGSENSAPRTINRGVFTYGGGVDIRTFSWLSLRGELRDFYSGSPAYSVAGAGGGQHNPVVSAGLVFRFGD